ncbi:MAG: hypothetical protein ACRDQ0_09055, partial [Pseudonocardia sp.]
RARRSVGKTQAARELEFAAITEARSPDSVELRSTRWQDPPRGSAARQHILVGDFGSDGLVEVALSAHLTHLQQRILDEPGTAGHWHLRVSATDPGMSIGTAQAEAGGWVEGVDHGRRDAFLAAREALFAEIRRPSDEDGAPQPVEAVDLHAFSDLVVAYADTYATLLDAHRDNDDPRVLESLAALARIDTITLTLVDHRDVPHEVVLVAPTHPSRILWLTAWSLVGRNWARTADPAAAQRADHALRRITALGHPLVIPRSGGQLAMAAFDLTPYWEVCLPDGTMDPQRLLAMVQTALEVPERSSPADVWSGASLADRLELYVRQHPYVATLVVNAVNVGRGDELAEAVELMAVRCPGIGLVLRLFVADPDAPGSGHAVLDLIESVDAPRGVTLAMRGRAEFGDVVDDAAHITVLFDALSAEHVGTTALDGHESARPLPVHGLVQEMIVDYSDEPDSPTVWRKRPRHGVAGELPGGEEVTDLLSTLPLALSAVAAKLATGQVDQLRVPEQSLTLSADDSSLLDHAHRSSDWVITIDRTLGIEFFDGPRGEQRPDYVIDYAPDVSTALGHQMVVSSRSLDELRALLTPILRDTTLDLPARHVATFFDQLRLLSGRLAFKIASVAPAQRTEVLGLALARLYLEERGALRHQILVPLDSHQELYAESGRDVEGGLRRTDLALFDLDATSRSVTCRLVEVKCFTTESGVAGYERLKDRIRGQIARSAEVLAGHFDPAHPRPDRVAKNDELSRMLRFYL